MQHLSRIKLLILRHSQILRRQMPLRMVIVARALVVVSLIVVEIIDLEVIVVLMVRRASRSINQRLRSRYATFCSSVCTLCGCVVW
jgi:hypothetical protein